LAFGVFIHRSDSVYDDIPAESYQFPAQYLGRIQSCIGDWIVYLEPSKIPQTRGYFATAKVQQIVPDPGAPGMYRAIIEAGTYLEFAGPVPFNRPDGIVERGLLNDEGRICGRAQSAVRPLSPADFRRIIEAGLYDHEALPRIGDVVSDGFEDEQAPFIYEQERVRIEQLASRVVRDRVFRSLVLNAYDRRCAVTGLKLINGAGAPRSKLLTFARSKPMVPTVCAMESLCRALRIGCSIGA
jgi:putative restriction endonuclease